jgi:SAM-dependent methyltransferase
MSPTRNIDLKTVEGFGDEWQRFDQKTLNEVELKRLFQEYFRIFPWDKLDTDAVGFDLGCGSGRWARLVAPRVGRLHCIDASEAALSVARGNLESCPNCEFHCAAVDAIPLRPATMDFGYSLGVLHHIPDTSAGIKACAHLLKPGAPFLVYLYYAFDNRTIWYRLIWRISDGVRVIIARMPMGFRYWLSQLIAGLVYYPLARAALLLEKLGVEVSSMPLSVYRARSFYVMRTDALDRFGTQLEHRFTAAQIHQMLTDAGLEKIRFSDRPPYWCAVGFKS